MIYDIYPMNSYVGNSSATTFGFDFYIENENQLNVYLYNSQGSKDLLSYNVDYTIDEFKNPNGSFITFPIQGSRYNILSQDETITLELTLPISQETEYNNSSLLNLQSLEYSFDYVTRLIQILSKRINNCLEIGKYTPKNISELIQFIENCSKNVERLYDDIINYRYNLASESSWGVVKIGSGINVDSQGLISVTDFSDLSLSNLTSQGQNISNWSSNVSNCITEIPQDIILELSNGTLTLKAGSKVYVPNGFEADGVTPKFDTVTIANDITTTDSASRNIWIGVNLDGSAMVFGVDSETGTPVLNTYKYYYDPSANMCYLNVGASSIQVSLPICIATSDSSGIVELLNIFNGLGFIGSTVFALPQTKIAIPNGRNTDGTLKSILSTVNTVLFATNIYGANNYNIGYDGSNIYISNIISYAEKENYTLYNNSSLISWAILGNIKCDSNNKLSDFKPKTVFHAANYNDVWAKQDTHVVVETYSNGTSWYRVYSDGWCEQGGELQTNVTFLKNFVDTNYVITLGQSGSSSSATVGRSTWLIKNTSGFTAHAETPTNWQACGYIS